MYFLFYYQLILNYKNKTLQLMFKLFVVFTVLQGMLCQLIPTNMRGQTSKIIYSGTFSSNQYDGSLFPFESSWSKPRSLEPQYGLFDLDIKYNRRSSYTPITMSYMEYLIKFKKNTKQPFEQFMYRANIYYQNVKFINNNNRNPYRTANYSVNYFTDLQNNEFGQIHKIELPEYRPFGCDDFSRTPCIPSTPRLHKIVETAQTDWTEGELMPPIFNQGPCGSCYAVATLETIQISLNIRGNKTEQLSVQHIISCAGDYTIGCKNGQIQKVYAYVKEDGVGVQSLYPYSWDSLLKGLNQPCKLSIIQSEQYKKTIVKIPSYKLTGWLNCNDIILQLKQTVVTSIIGNDMAYQFHKDGVMYPVSGKLLSFNTMFHAITIVGYNPRQMFKFRNSLGATWGEKGYGYAAPEMGVCYRGFYPDFQSFDIPDIFG